MSKDKKFKRELRKIDRLLNASENVYNNGNGLAIIDEKTTGKAIEYCIKAKNIIKKSKDDRHEKPHPLLARHVGISVRSSQEIPHEKNEDIIQNIAFNRLFNFLLMVPENGYRKDKINLMFKLLDEKTRNHMEQLGIGKDNMVKYVERVLIDYAIKLKEDYEKIKELNKEKKYEIGLLEKFCNDIEKFKEMKEKFDPKGKLVGEESIYNEVLDYSLNGFSNILKGLKDGLMENPNSIYHILFSNLGMKDKETLEDFMRKNTDNSEKYYETSSGLNLKLTQEQIEKDSKYIDDRKKAFAGIMEKKQDEMCNTAMELAEKGDKNYKIYLNHFIGMTVNYSKLLDEDNEDIAKMFACINPDAHVIMNEAYKDKGVLPLYKFYKKDMPEIARAVLNIKLAYIRAKNKKDKEKYEKKK